MQSAAIQVRHKPTTIDAICIAILIAYFLHFALPARHGGFREDEMMNMGICWQAGAFKSLLANIVFWKLSYVPAGAIGDVPLYLYRPGGALYYLPLYHFFGLNPSPYRIVQICILALSIPIAYYLARLLTSSHLVAFLAVLAFCYHPYVANLVFVGAFIYDVLCGFFYLSALAYYVHLRQQDIRLRAVHLLIFLLLYVLALNSKEMAVTLPVIVLVYEALKSLHWAGWGALLSWTWRCASASLISGAVTGIYLYRKLYGSGSLTVLDPYRPRYSWHQFATANAKFLNELFFAPGAFTPRTFWILWVAASIYAVFRRDRTIRLMAAWIVIVPLPIVFLFPIRGGGCLYLLLFGWAMILAKAAYDVIELISRRFMLSRKTAAHALRIALASVLAVSFALFVQWENRRLWIVPNLLAVGHKVSHVIAAFDSLNLHPASGSTVLLKPDEQLFHNKWHSLFIASMVWNDHSLQIWIDKLSHVTPEQLAKFDYIISLAEFEATLVRSPDMKAN